MGWEVKRYPLYYGGVKEPCSSKMVVVGNMVFLSSMDGRSLGTGRVPSAKFDEQMIQCLDNVRLSLEESGSSMGNIIKLLAFVRNCEDFPSMWRVMLEYYQKYAPALVEEPPVITCAQISPMVHLDSLVELDVTAVVSNDDPGWAVKKQPMYYGGVRRAYPDIKPGMPFMSESVTVGNLIFLSGMGAEDPETGEIETNIFADQMNISLDKIRKAMDNAGSTLSNIIRTFHFQTRMEGLLGEGKERGAAYNPASDELWHAELWHYDKYAPYLLDYPPTSTFMKLLSVANPDAQVSIDITGVVDRFNKSGWEFRWFPSYMAKRGFPRHIGDIIKYYANVIVVGNLAWISGQPGWDLATGRIEADDFEGQMETALYNLKYAMEQAGSSLDNVVKTHMLLPEGANYEKMRQMELDYYKKYAPKLVEAPPASSCIQLYNLYSPKAIIEIDAVGYIPDQPKY